MLFHDTGPILIPVANGSIINLLFNPVYRSTAQHIDVKVSHARKFIKEKPIAIKYLSSKGMKADVMTKMLPKFLHMKIIDVNVSQYVCV